MLQPPRRKARGPDAGRGRRERERSTEPLPAPRAPLLPPMERAKGKGSPGMFVIEVNMITNAASWILDGCGAHICNNLQVLGRSRKLSKDEMILRLGDRKAVVAEAVGSLNLVIGDHIRIELKDCYSVLSMIKNIISIPILDNNGYAFKINKNGLMIDDNYHLFGTLGYALETAAKFLNIAPSKTVTQTPYEIWHGKPTSYKYLRVILEKEFSLDNRRDELVLEESSEPPQQNNTTSLEPSFPTDGVPFLCISTRESRLPERQVAEVMKSKMDSIDSNQVWTLVDPPKGIKPVMDMKMAFLNGYVEEEIFLDQSKDFTSVGEEQKDMGEASYILGIKIYRDRSRKMLGLTQSSYIEKVLKRFKMENSKRGFLPMRHGIKRPRSNLLRLMRSLKGCWTSPIPQSLEAFICCPVH
ncbi:hypothetical protein Sango_2890600 [Sesamum angolense]|uniref:Retrovirus-related Pol polyprotein from transposon TNT 1-94-like beta-barrel domain-containing protein n=1 Tax=Sesamum angolense TaxID=2727404 RepID=A0AAE1T5F3_9LAMI|nr:hypothetical protein Sango_2890600 [Sesamum angolense]